MNYDRMDDCFASLNDKIFYALDHSDLDDIFDKLDAIEGPTLVCGVGGSSVVSMFLAKVLREKKHMIATFVYPRDLKYMDLSGYENIISVSYSGNNIGVTAMKDTELNQYLFTGFQKEGVTSLVYHMKEEISYVSISATMVPLSILLMYYKNDRDLLKEILNQDIRTDSSSMAYEVMSGYETQTAGIMLESSITESGMASCILHDKYNYCHGRINLSRHNDADLIFFKAENELDDMLYRQLQSHYKKIIPICTKYEDDVINDYYSTLLSLKLIHQIALNKGAEISDMNELEDNDVFYLYKGEM